MLGFELVEVGSGGRASCVACGGSSSTPTYLESPAVVAAIEEAVKRSPAPGPNIMLGGADAFGHPNLPALVGAAVRSGAARIGLETDGGALATGGNAAGALHAGVRHVRVSCADRGRASAGIAAFVAAAEASGADAVATAVIRVCRHNLEELPTIVAEMAEAGALGVTIDASGIKTGRDVGALLASACDTGTVNGVWVEVMGAGSVLPASHSMHVAADGDAS